ncbi:importin subunit beta-1-like [Styela clava]|uniref:importin subunit beta-1-like n=1 Tax=Styela clava TaxID=7725 RepID=UPI0019397DD3|nr:importin subunit beta-1-like [Styela clava]
MATLVEILDKTVSPDPNDIKQAQGFLEQAAQSSLAEFLVSLCQVLANPGNSQVSRMAAGLQIKNYTTSKDQTARLDNQKRWLSLNEAARSEVKKLVLQALGTETNRPSSAAQVIASIACAEIPLDGWKELIPQLVQSVTAETSTEHLKEGALEAIGYICADMDPQHLLTHANGILTAIVQGMRKQEPSFHVKLAATNAMLNSLEFTRGNFEKESERHFIMQVICEATQVEDSKTGTNSIRVAALQCLVKIMSLYYQYMEAYMGPALFAISVEAMKSADDNVCLQGIEFWSNVCDEESDLSIEMAEADEMGRAPERTSKFYAKGALQYLVPILTQILTRQDVMDDEDEWNPSKAAGVCLMLLATCCENDIVPHVVPFLEENINSPDWRYRDAAVMTLGSILEGPSPDQLAPILEQGMPTFFTLLKDESVVVRDTTAWAIGRICDLIPDAVINEKYLMPLLTAMVESLTAEPRVATNVCWAFSSLAEAAYENACNEASGEDPETYPMSMVYENIIEKLLNTTDRQDGHQNNLRSSAYEAIMEMIKNSPQDCYDTVLKTTNVIMDRINQLLMMESQIHSSSDRSQYNDLQSLLCATLQSVLQKVKPEHVASIADNVMGSLLRMLGSGSGGVQEDTMMAVGTFVEVVGDKFVNYLPAFKDYLFSALRNPTEYQVCIVAVGVVGDICRSIGAQVLQYCDQIMTHLLDDLSDPTVHRTVKPHILSVFGDIALAIGAEFKKYLEVVLQTLQQAAQARVDTSDYDMVDYLNELREGCLESYTGIIQGLKGDQKDPHPDVLLVKDHIMFILTFVEDIANDEDHSDGVVAASSGLLGDLCTAFGGQFGNHLLKLIDSKPKILEMLTEGRRSKTSKTKSLAVWTTKELRKLRNKA